MEGGLLLDVVVRQGPAILELLASKDEPLLVRRNALLVLDLCLHVVNGVRALNLQGDGLPGECLHKDLHTTTQTQHQVEGGLLLDVVVGKGSPILKLLASEDEPLLVRRDAFLVLDFGLHVVDGVGALNLQSDGLPGEGLNKDLHSSTETQNQVKGRLLLNVVVRQSTAVLKLLSSEDQPLLVRWDTLLVLDLGLDVVNGVRAFDLKGDGLPGEGLHKYLHSTT